MKTAFSHTLLLMCLCIPSAAFAYGEDGDFSIPYAARATHMMTNEARTAPHIAMASCGKNCAEGLKCYKESLQPLYWDQKAARASQFYAQMLTHVKCIQHDTPCTLVSTIASLFPDACDGNPSCACVEKKATCGNSGTSSFDRLKLFTGSSYYAENICSGGSINCVSRLINEDNTGGTKCEFRWTGSKGNGHRWNLFGTDYTSIGVGADGYIVQNLGKSSDTYQLTAGSHYTSDGKLWFKTHYYSKTTDIKKAVVVINDKCIELEKTVGLSLKNVVFGTSNVSSIEACTPYFFESLDADGNFARFPTTGSLLYIPDDYLKNTYCEGKAWKNVEGISCLNPPKCEAGQHVYGNTCETDDINNCGNHGVSCMIENAEATCTNGQCTISSCQAGYHIYESICEVDNVNNCGDHNVSCMAENANETACTDGQCVTISCLSGYHLYENTCEIDSLENCGSHGMTCGAEGATEVTCQDSQCVVIACEEGKQLENNQCVDAGSPDNPTPEDPDNPTPDNPDNPTPDNPDNPSPDDSDGSSQSSSDSDCSSAPLMNTHTSPFWFLLGLFGLGIARRRRDD